jgi:hypothetical protein
MLWMGIGVTSFVVLIIMMLVVFGRRPKRDLGSVSAHWVMTHRVDSQ